MCALVTGVQTCALPIYGLAGRDEFDVVADFSAPLPTQVILTLFGLPLSDAARITEWSEDLAAFVGGAKLIPDKRSEERRVGKERVGPCKASGAPDIQKEKYKR